MLSWALKDKKSISNINEVLQVAKSRIVSAVTQQEGKMSIYARGKDVNIQYQSK